MFRSFPIRSNIALKLTIITVSDVKEYVAAADRFREGTMERLLCQYKSIGPLLKKVAVLIGQDSSRFLSEYYAHWERKIFDALTTLTVNNFHSAVYLMTKSSTALFRVDVRLSAPELVLSPSASELYRMLLGLFRNLLDSMKSFLRWQHGTCQLTKELQVEGEDAPIVFSFYDDVTAHPRVRELISDVDKLIKDMFDSIANYLARWKRYSALWKLDKSGSVNKFAARNPTAAQYDTKLTFYTQLSEEVAQHKRSKRVSFVELHLPPLVDTVRDGALAWVSSLGNALSSYTVQNTQLLLDRIENWSAGLKAEPTDLEALKRILRTMGEIRDETLSVQLEIDDLTERLRVLKKYDAVEIALSTEELISSLPATWERLLGDSEEVDDTLVSVKNKFSRITTVDVEKFVADLDDLATDFFQEGPSSYVGFYY